MNSEKILRIYTLLTGLKNNLPEGLEIDEGYALKYNDLIDELSISSKCNLDEYKVPQIEIKPIKIFTTYGRTKCLSKNCVEKKILVSLLDAILLYFEIKYISEKKKDIGFLPPIK